MKNNSFDINIQSDENPIPPWLLAILTEDEMDDDELLMKLEKVL